MAVSHHQPDRVQVREADILELAQGLLQRESRLCKSPLQGVVGDLGDIAYALWEGWEKRAKREA